MSRPEADIHFELYRHLQNSIEEKSTYYGIHFEGTRAEVNVDSGFADIVVFGEGEKPFLVIEAKRKTKGGYDRNIDPYSPEVIDQSFHYAGKLGAEYFATYNGERLVLFRTFEGGTHLLDRKTNAYAVQNIQEFAPSFLQEVAGLETGKLKWEPKHRAFVKRLEEFHGRLMMQMEEALRGKLDSDEKFKERYEEWVAAQGWDTENWSKILQRFTAQAAYLLMNKLVFYKILEDEPAYREIPELEFTSTENLTADLQHLFSRLVEEVDFEAIYEQDPIYDEVPLTSRAATEIQEFLEELEEYDLTQFDHDVIGTIYGKIIPPKERHDLGQYYTPPEIVELITRLTVQEPGDKVLDPGCGSGSFLVAAYNRLKNLKKKAGKSVNHIDLLTQLYGIDINRFPAHLSAINLALRDLSSKTEKVNLEVQDFFRVYPKQDRLAVEKVGVKGTRKITDPSELDLPKEVNAVIANPPYIRQEKIADKELCRKHLERIGYEDISERSDIYVYFFTHAKEFLKENGRIGFITSDKWLTVGYGKDLQEYFLDNFKILAIIEFNKGVFEEPLVPTCVTILEKCANSKKRKENKVKFVRVKREMDIDTLTKVMKKDYKVDKLSENKNLRIICKKQKELREEEKWDKYLLAPSIYWQLISHSSMIPLKDIATIRRGVTTGANDFFYLEQEMVEEWGINEQFLRPLAKSIRQTNTVSFEKEDTDLLILDINEYVTSKIKEWEEKQLKTVKLPSIPSDARKEDLTPKESYILKELNKENEGLYQYIIHSMWEKEWGRYGPPQKRPTCEGHRKQNYCWFNLGELPSSDILIPKGCWERIFVPLNEDKLVAGVRIYDVFLSEDYDPKLIAGILNSSLWILFREIDGRITGGGMSELAVYEAERLPIPDPSTLSKTETREIKDCFDKLQEIKVGSEEYEEKRKMLDRAVLKPLDMENRVEELYKIVRTLSKARREGKKPKILIEGVEREEKRINIRGGERVEKEGQKKLKDFN